jgi:small conductance mechanosensitive channel
VSRLSHRIVNGMRLVSPLVQATPRGAARVQTLAGAFTSVFRAVIWVIAFLEVLNEFSINLAPFLAGATVVGAALGFGAQSLVKDFLSGMLILAEDQYGVGDHVAIGTGATQTSGTVESVNLRVTRLRGADGGILYVPNGEIRTLSNDTETDSQALVDLVLPFGTDLVAAGVAAQEAAQEMAEDPEWASEFSGPPYFAGVQDATSANGVVVRIMALTRPGQHLRLAREMRLRIIERLREDGVAWAPSRRQEKRGAEPPPLESAPPAGLTEPTPRTPPAARAATKPTAGSPAGSGAAQADPAQPASPRKKAAAKATKAMARKLTRKSD